MTVARNQPARRVSRPRRKLTDVGGNLDVAERCRRWEQLGPRDARGPTARLGRSMLVTSTASRRRVTCSPGGDPSVTPARAVGSSLSMPRSGGNGTTTAVPGHGSLCSTPSAARRRFRHSTSGCETLGAGGVSGRCQARRSRCERALPRHLCLSGWTSAPLRIESALQRTPFSAGVASGVPHLPSSGRRWLHARGAAPFVPAALVAPRAGLPSLRRGHGSDLGAAGRRIAAGRSGCRAGQADTRVAIAHADRPRGRAGAKTDPTRCCATRPRRKARRRESSRCSAISPTLPRADGPSSRAYRNACPWQEWRSWSVSGARNCPVGSNCASTGASPASWW